MIYLLPGTLLLAVKRKDAECLIRPGFLTAEQSINLHVHNVLQCLGKKDRSES